uniref:Putative tigger transposase n=1 Tax=Amblyomma triste TaxID=251400 RepID=A0A023GKX0_AMBTT
MAPSVSRRKCLTLEQKVLLIKEVEKGRRQKTDIAKEFGIPPSTLSTVLKNKDAVLDGFEKSFSSKRKRNRDSKYPEVEGALLQWLKNARSANLPVNGPALTAKAEALALQMGHKDFKCSNGWLERFKKRHGVTSKTIVGESAAVSRDTVDVWRQHRLQALLEKYEDKDIYNLDEAAFFYKMLPNRTFTTPGASSSGGKQSKERVTVLLGANATGEDKLPLLILGKAEKPRCFRNATVPNECVYRSNKRAWMTAAIFEDYVRLMDRRFGAKNRQVLFIIDNCPSHGKINHLKAITLEFLPANTTAVLQPMDQGIIETTRKLYRKALLQRMLTAYDASKSYSIDLLGAIHLLNFSWKELAPSKIANCFAHAGFSRAAVTDPDDDQPDDDQTCSDLYEAVHKIAGEEVDGDFDTFALADAAAPVVAPATDAEIIDAVGGPDEDEEPADDSVKGLVHQKSGIGIMSEKSLTSMALAGSSWQLTWPAH